MKTLLGVFDPEETGAKIRDVRPQLNITQPVALTVHAFITASEMMGAGGSMDQSKHHFKLVRRRLDIVKY